MLNFFASKINWTLSSDYQQTPLAEVFYSFDAAYDYPGERIAYSPLSQVYKANIGGTVYYIKKYNISRKLLQRYSGQSKISTEWKNLLWFSFLGIAVPDVVAYGEEKRGWVTYRGVLITKELKNTRDLGYIADHLPQLLKSGAWFQQISHQVANATRIMHQHHFAHNDLKWRNILVDIEEEFPQVYFIDCPSGRKWIQPFLNYRIIKDLACLDKRGKYELSKKQRLAFYKDYKQCRKLTPRHKKQIKKILQFFHNRE